MGGTREPVRGTRRRRGARLREERGVALVEFALVAPLLMLLLFGMVDFGKAFNYWIDETHLANMGARMAVVDYWPTKGSQSLQDYVREQADTGELRDNAIVCIDYSAGHVQGQPITVTVQLPAYEWINFIKNKLDFKPPHPPTKITAHSTMRLEKDTSDYTVANPPGCP
jgi:Flp pilus assembly protein TadG